MNRSTSTAPTTRRVSALAVAIVALVATLVIAVAVFAWTTVGRSDPVPPTLPAVESDEPPAVPSSNADLLPADGVPVLNENCVPGSQFCAF